MIKIKTQNTLTILLGHRQAETGERWSLRQLAREAKVPKDLVYRLDAGTARYVSLDALARLCHVLECEPGDILIWHNGDDEEGGRA
jgi:DNA-binding Xre family transcriptional regulator